MFLPHKSDTGTHQPWEWLPAAAGTYKVGQLLNVSGGQLVPVTGASATTPAYLCQADITVEAGHNVPVQRVSGSYIYETQLSAAAEGAVIGTKLQVSAGGLQVDKTVAGSFEIVEIEGTAAGSTVRGRFK